MSILDDLQSAVSTVAERAGPSIVGIGRGNRGSGVVIADGKVLTNAHNLRGDEVTVTFADGRRTRGTVAGVDGDGDLAVVDVDTAGATPLDLGRRRGPRHRHRRLRSGREPRRRDARHVRARLGDRSLVPRPGWPADQRQPRAHRSPGARLVRRRARWTRPAPSSASTRTGSARASTWPCPADAALRERVDALGRGESPTPIRLGVAVAPAHVARRMRRAVGLPERDGVLVRGVEDDSLADAAGIDAGDLIVSAGGKPISDADDLFEALGTLKRPFDLVLVRGSEERTVSVG